MDEAQRIAYLKHMGYKQYYSRYVLVGAKASVIPQQHKTLMILRVLSSCLKRQYRPIRRAGALCKAEFDAGKRHRAIAAER